MNAALRSIVGRARAIIAIFPGCRREETGARGNAVPSRRDGPSTARHGFAAGALTLALMACLAAAGCGKSALTRFYTLESDPEASKAAPCVSLGVGPVDFPPYLDRTQIVTRLDGARMHLAEFDQWIEPLHDAFARALAANLTRQGCDKPVVQTPLPPGVKPRYQLAVQVRRFDAVPGREAVLEAGWAILDDGGKTLAYKSSVLREPLSGMDYPHIAKAQSALTARLASEVAGELGKLPR